MFNHVLLTELCRQRRRDVAREVALCHQVPSPRRVIGDTLVAVGGLAIFIGTAIGDESERQPKITVA
jgi:hypothetical protein